MKNRQVTIPLFLIALVSVILILMFYFRFELRLFFPTRLHRYIHFIILLLFMLNFSLTILVTLRLHIKNFFKPFIVILFTLGLIIVLNNSYHSSRKTEMFQFVVKNENNLKKIVDLHKEYEINNFQNADTTLLSLQRLVNIRLCTRNYKYNCKDYKDILFLNMFVLAGYGYGVAYSDVSNPVSPRSYHMSPMVEWYRIKDNWFYFEYFD